MIHTFRCAWVALLFGLLLAGCSGNESSESRRASADARSARTAGRSSADRDHGRGASSESGTRPDEVLGYVGQSGSPNDITLDEVQEYVRNHQAAVIDARSPSDFAMGHVRGALNMPVGQKEAYLAQIKSKVGPDELIIIYCNGPHCDSGDRVYEYLASQGYTNMRVFKPGWQALSSVKELR